MLDHLRLIGSLVLLGLANPAPAVETGPQPLTAAAALETARLMIRPDDGGPANPDGAVSLSPSGRRYVARVVRGDVARNGVWMELITGRMASPEAAASHRTVARLFTSGLGPGEGNVGAHLDTLASANPLYWIDDEHVAFLWSDKRAIRQVVRVGLSTGEVEYLTHHPSPVADFALGRANVVLYNVKAQSPVPSLDRLKDGYVIPDDLDGYGLFHRDIDAGSGYDRNLNSEWFVQFASEREPRRIRVAGRDVDPFNQHRISISPDGRVAIVSTTAPQIRQEWDAYTDRSIRDRIAAARDDPEGMLGRLAFQLHVVDLESGATRPLWGSLSPLQAAVAWSPDSRSVLLAPTFLPPEGADATGLDGRAAAVVDIATGDYEALPIDLRQDVVDLRWPAADRIELTERTGTELRPRRFWRSAERWREAQGAGHVSERQRPRTLIALRQDLNTPPRLFAVDLASGRERMILDLNPGLTEAFDLGRVERIDGTLENGTAWHGLLFHPVDAVAGRRYPLVIQSTYGALPGLAFTLYGYQGDGALGPTLIAPYPGQVLANRGIAVLHLNVRTGSAAGTPEEPLIRMRAFEAAAEHLIEEGLVDGQKVGLAGFSRNGYYVEYTLAHSAFPFAAAIAADNWDPSYFQQTLTGYGASASGVNGGPPFGDGLRSWLENAPGFNAGRIRTPLRMIQQSHGLFGVLAKWETFSRLRYLNKPVEFYVMPDAERYGAHNTQNPQQILAVLQGTVDWFDFWLNGREDGDPSKVNQYVRWRKLRTLRGE